MTDEAIVDAIESIARSLRRIADYYDPPVKTVQECWVARGVEGTSFAVRCRLASEHPGEHEYPDTSRYEKTA